MLFRSYDADLAVTQGTKEVLRSIIASTLTTIIVFLPFLFSSEFMIKLLGNNIGVSVISTMIISLFVALLLVPIGAHILLKGKRSKNIFYEKVTTNNRIIQIYVLLLKASMRGPASTIIGAIVLFFVTIFVILAISVNNLEEVEETQFSIYVTMPTGSTLESTDLVVADVETRLSEIAEKKDLISRIQEEEAVLTFILNEDYKEIDDRTIAEIKADVETRINNIAKAEISLTAPTTGGSFGSRGRSGTEGFSNFMGIGTNQERVVIKGEDFDIMKGVAEDLQYYIEDLESIRNANISVSSNRPEIHLYFNQILLTEYGITLGNITSELRSEERRVGQ